MESRICGMLFTPQVLQVEQQEDKTGTSHPIFPLLHRPGQQHWAQFSPALGSRLHKLHSNHSASPVVERAQTNGLAWLLHSGFPKAAILTLFACSTPSDVLQIWGGVRRAAMKCSFSTAAFMKRLCRGSLPWRNPAQGKLCLIARAAMTLLWKCWNLAHIKEFCAHMLGGAGSKVFSPNSDTLAAQ